VRLDLTSLTAYDAPAAAGCDERRLRRRRCSARARRDISTNSCLRDKHFGALDESLERVTTNLLRME